MSGEPFPEIKSKDSLVAKYVTKPIWEKLSGVVTKVGLNRKCLGTVSKQKKIVLKLMFKTGYFYVGNSERLFIIRKLELKVFKYFW